MAEQNAATWEVPDYPGWGAGYLVSRPSPLYYSNPSMLDSAVTSRTCDAWFPIHVTQAPHQPEDKQLEHVTATSLSRDRMGEGSLFGVSV